MKKQKFNKIDQLITNMSIEFSKIPNFDLTQTDVDANRLFNLIIAKTSDLQDSKTIYQQCFIPATKKANYTNNSIIFKLNCGSSIGFQMA